MVGKGLKSWGGDTVPPAQPYTESLRVSTTQLGLRIHQHYFSYVKGSGNLGVGIVRSRLDAGVVP